MDICYTITNWYTSHMNFATSVMPPLHGVKPDYILSLTLQHADFISRVKILSLINLLYVSGHLLFTLVYGV